ncbi:FAD-dependent monooxygenase [Nonomuraea sp. PA05]|uniref:FAD-dependent monooxygenase n=1 Tax=Nonomuraea sp. PA05 TaxID=2604466 RepID=UPI001CA31B7B|nr:FAD-dependent monooxygenase [Nonomuraea sp. PA05]
MEAVMSVGDSKQEHTVRTGEQGTRASGPRVLVAGASIAGPALAHWLRRRGAEVTVVERAPRLRPGGQAVDARGVAKEVIGRMGLDAAVRAACTDTAGAHIVDADGQVLETFRADDHGGDGFIADIEILRGDLSQVLYDDTRDGVEYVFGDRIAELGQDADGVDVVFAGGDRRRFDLVIGADGLHSQLRAMVFGPREHFVRHLGLVLAFYSVPNEFGVDRWMIDHQEAGRSAGLRPVPDATRAMAMFSFPAADFDVDHRDVAAQKRLLRERMDGFGWLTQRILAHVDDTPDFYLDQVAQVVMDRWSSGRVGLLGDAAFSASPMSGAGTGLALVGAYLLAGELAAAGWDPEAGFAGYETRMRSFVEANQEIGRLHVHSLAVPGPDAVPSPDFAGEWFTELIERAINGVELPDYR